MDKLCYNIKTNKVIKQIIKVSTIGYIINDKFISSKSNTFFLVII